MSIRDTDAYVVYNNATHKFLEGMDIIPVDNKTGQVVFKWTDTKDDAYIFITSEEQFGTRHKKILGDDITLIPFNK